MDKTTFRHLYNEHYKEVFNYLYFYCKNYELCRDLTQDTFFKIWENSHKLKKGKSPLPYILIMAKNLLLDYYRHQKVERKHMEEAIHDQSFEDNLESQAHANMLEEKIREIVKVELSEKSQSIFLMSRFEGKSNDDISKVFGISKKTVENQIYKATALLREKMKNFLVVFL